MKVTDAPSNFNREPDFGVIMRLQHLYLKLKQNYLDELSYSVPLRYQSSFVHWGGGAEAQFIHKRFLLDVPAGGRVLIVGAMGGRDYFLLKNLAFDVVVIDIGPQPDIDPITFWNVEEPLPFENGSFDAVLIGEVLEHLREDAKALDNIRQVLKPDGRLIVTVPYFNDREEGHVRIHSPFSAERLLRMSGFSVEDYVERPGLFTLVRFNAFQHGLSLLWYLLRGRTAYGYLTHAIGRMEWRLGHIKWLRFVRRHSRSFGGHFLCRRSAVFDHVELNKRLYTSATVLSGSRAGYQQQGCGAKGRIFSE